MFSKGHGFDKHYGGLTQQQDCPTLSTVWVSLCVLQLMKDLGPKRSVSDDKNSLSII